MQPVTTRGHDEIIAWRRGYAVTVGQLIAEASVLAEQLPWTGYVINYCRSRYRFTRALLAAVIANQTSLLPPDRLTSTADQLLADYPNATMLTDDGEAGDATLSAVMRTRIDHHPTDTPQIADDHIAAIAFTSGSTGRPKAIEKPWGTLFEGAQINSAALGLDDGQQRALLATVPPQHMYGLETSVMNALVANVAAADEQPLMPADVTAQLEALPATRILMTTPAQLRSLDDPELKLPSVATIWSATAPLDPQLAQRIETQHHTRVCEIYGCTEVGSLAQRRPSVSTDWRLFPGFTLTATDETQTQASAPHLRESRILPDRLARSGAAHFQIMGRHEDVVNVAGKRASLADLNSALRGLDGVQDGLIIARDPHHAAHTERLAALLVAPELEPSDVRDRLRELIDTVFLPRPIFHVEAIPRTETGKALQRVAKEQLAAFEQAGEFQRRRA